MFRLTYFILAFFVIIYCSDTFAAMDGEALPDDTVTSVVYKRIKAQQEYQVYKMKKKSLKRPVAETKAEPVSEKAIAVKGKDVTIGIGLILLAAILSVYLYRLSKKG